MTSPGRLEMKLHTWSTVHCAGLECEVRSVGETTSRGEVGALLVSLVLVSLSRTFCSVCLRSLVFIGAAASSSPSCGGRWRILHCSVVPCFTCNVQNKTMRCVLELLSSFQFDKSVFVCVSVLTSSSKITLNNEFTVKTKQL